MENWKNNRIGSCTTLFQGRWFHDEASQIWCIVRWCYPHQWEIALANRIRFARADRFDNYTYTVLRSSGTLKTNKRFALGHADFYPNGGRSQPGCDSSFFEHLSSIHLQGMYRYSNNILIHWKERCCLLLVSKKSYRCLNLFLSHKMSNCFWQWLIRLYAVTDVPMFTWRSRWYPRLSTIAPSGHIIGICRIEIWYSEWQQNFATKILAPRWA